ALLTRRRRPMTRAFGVLAAAALVLLMAPVGASAEPDELIPCRLFVSRIEPGVPPGGRGMTKFVCEGTFLLPSAGAVPLGSTGVAPNGSTGAHWTWHRCRPETVSMSAGLVAVRRWAIPRVGGLRMWSGLPFQAEPSAGEIQVRRAKHLPRW